ncbi:radical SAM protein [Fibrobacter sp. HC4]|uniref:radical SAM protein n=1 Tax=Fibrobacter sp. HC4 TaxID=3239812 RepID=UPI000C710FC0|nr:radical SAM protein [Fibrobacter succinogenes]MCL4100732.1 hypothetical protein [Fibrobacter succinogenes]
MNEQEKTQEQNKALIAAWSDHSRMWKDNTWVYPVISRRAGGLSVGINLNPDHKCSFACAYCQSGPQEGHESVAIDIDGVERELRQFLEFYKSGEFSKCDFFGHVPEDKKILKDICLSGDGESTIVKEFPEVCKRMRKLQKENEGQFKLRLITNASRLGNEKVEDALAYLLESDGEIWAKLDAGTEEWYKRMNRSAVKFETILNNLEKVIKLYPICIQTMLCSLQGDVPTDAEIEQYIGHLQRIYAAAPKNFVEVQLYTVIRQTATPDVLPLPKEFLEAVAKKINEKLPVQVRIF